MRIISTLVAMATVMLMACNAESNKTNDDKKTDAAKQEMAVAGNLVNLDTAQHIQSILCQAWVLEEDAEGLDGMSESSQMEIPYRSFYFSTEGSFVKNPRNSFDYGPWSYDDAGKMISLTNTVDRGTVRYKIAKVSSDELVLVNTGVGSSTNLKFVSPGLRYKNPADEPFYLENNRWRIKPKNKETDEQVHQRLKENMHFFILYYRSVLDKGDKVVSFWGLPSCFKWYGGGIFLKKENELQPNWINCFYNREQAMQAYHLAEKLLDQKYTWPKDEQNWIKLNLAVLEQMYGKIDEVH